MKILGITGGVGAGKSFVLSYLEKKENTIVFQADDIARKLQSKGSICLEKMVSYFGEEILTDEMELNRGKLREFVFHDSKALQALNEIVHPLVFKEVENLISINKQLGMKVFVLESAILLEANYGKICDEVWYIYADDKTRKQRLLESRGYTDALFLEMNSKQLNEEKFRLHCHRVINNQGVIDEIYRTIDDELQQFMGE